MSIFLNLFCNEQFVCVRSAFFIHGIGLLPPPFGLRLCWTIFNCIGISSFQIVKIIFSFFAFFWKFAFIRFCDHFPPKRTFLECSSKAWSSWACSAGKAFVPPPMVFLWLQIFKSNLGLEGSIVRHFLSWNWICNFCLVFFLILLPFYYNLCVFCKKFLKNCTSRKWNIETCEGSLCWC